MAHCTFPTLIRQPRRGNGLMRSVVEWRLEAKVNVLKTTCESFLVGSCSSWDDSTHHWDRLGGRGMAVDKDEGTLLPSGWTFKMTPFSRGSFVKRKRVMDWSLRVLDESWKMTMMERTWLQPLGEDEAHRGHDLSKRKRVTTWANAKESQFEQRVDTPNNKPKKMRNNLLIQMLCTNNFFFF